MVIHMYIDVRLWMANFFIFSLFLKQISNLGRLRNYFKTRPFGPATMHGGAKTLHPAMHGGGVDPATWRCMAEGADLDPAMIAGGLGLPRRGS